MISVLTGTCLHPKRFIPAFIISYSTIALHFSCAPKSLFGKNIIPTPNIESLLVLWPIFNTCLLKKEFETSNIIPAPSPVLPSASTAPLWNTAFSASTPFSTISLLDSPLIEATKPTPQLSCSCFSL